MHCINYNWCSVVVLYAVYFAWLIHCIALIIIAVLLLFYISYAVYFAWLIHCITLVIICVLLFFVVVCFGIEVIDEAELNSVRTVMKEIMKDSFMKDYFYGTFEEETRSPTKKDNSLTEQWLKSYHHHHNFLLLVLLLLLYYCFFKLFLRVLHRASLSWLSNCYVMLCYVKSALGDSRTFTKLVPFNET